MLAVPCRAVTHRRDGHSGRNCADSKIEGVDGGCALALCDGESSLVAKTKFPAISHTLQGRRRAPFVRRPGIPDTQFHLFLNAPEFKYGNISQYIEFLGCTGNTQEYPNVISNALLPRQFLYTE